ncbi:MAG: DUF1028 domain-containing protein [Nitrososphaerota archaeon]|nr:DUF1028 domain-containing protein [Nitrososphaerota archaeon]MDG6912325.1 DUF1028 domain-containing protein [Nitrososphaerota archaeon]MDG6937416.1 DUF1028 domain-containing protein [Nitrososphaerota archaeon]MDG6958648.1 DUF1028 domain-containing protein [Nitrososphaerota archaeon]MDG6971097.1 DUF1028 domain-containing protein [Nitrososphaerota archaeon]
MTYSIVARDEKTGEMGVAVQSHYFSVGSAVPWARAGVGAVATQATLDVRYGPLGIEMMSGGMTAKRALTSLLEADVKPEVRQVAMVDAQGEVAAHTGEKCIPCAGHATGNGFSCQGNIMENHRVWGAMRRAFEGERGSPLPERLLAALDAAQAEGGDLRGKQSAALLVVGPELKPNHWEGRLFELRVEDHPEPLVELRRLLRYQRGYRWVDRGDDLLSSDRPEEALDAYTKGMGLVPEERELKYWVAIGLLSSGKDRRRGLRMLKEVCSKDSNWVRVTEGLLKIGQPKLEPSILRHVRE